MLLGTTSFWGGFQASFYLAPNKVCNNKLQMILTYDMLIQFSFCSAYVLNLWKYFYLLFIIESCVYWKNCSPTDSETLVVTLVIETLQSVYMII